MAKRRGRKPQLIPMKIGNDPALWRFASLQEALESNTHLIAQLIQAGKEQVKSDELQTGSSESISISEST